MFKLKLSDEWYLNAIKREEEAMTQERLTEEEFEEQYASNSGVTVQWLHSKGQQAVPCDCNDIGCKGWAMNENKVLLDAYRELDAANARIEGLESENRDLVKRIDDYMSLTNKELVGKCKRIEGLEEALKECGKTAEAIRKFKLSADDAHFNIKAIVDKALSTNGGK